MEARGRWLLTGSAVAAAATAIVVARRGRGKSAGIPLAAAAAAAVVMAWKVLRQKATRTPHAYLAMPSPPLFYIAKRGTPKVIDGDLSKDVWQNAPWSESFVEIRGPDAPEGSGPNPLQTTRMKMLWDDEFLYVGAVMDYDEGEQFVAKFTERNSPIFHTDSDFEVFIDPPGCCHWYKELELNPINTVWNLMLSRPYMDGGGELSGRVAKEGEKNHWDVRSQRTATRVLRGALHDSSKPSQWCCELAFAHSDTLSGAPISCKGSTPTVGAHWRINFSRVEKGGNVNWVWSPQRIWDPSKGRCEGKVNMHLPDAYGYVVFGDEHGKLVGRAVPDSWRDPAWPARFAAMSVYYAVRHFKESGEKRLPTSIEELEALNLLPDMGKGVAVYFRPTEMNNYGGFVATATVGPWTAEVNGEHLLNVFSSGSSR